MSANDSLLMPQDRVLSTLEKDGSRRWMYPRLAHGRFLWRRRIVAYILLALYVLIPFLKINGKPVLLLDLAGRRFTFFGATFLPTDTVLLALLMVSIILSIFFVTALLGRVWCGWACPQTVYMEFVFRPIERLFLGRAGRGGKPADNVAGWRKALMYLAFLVICLHLANTFLAYFVPANVLHTWITSSPAAHPAGFAIVAIVTGLMMFDFCIFREQTCIIACPYGRLQSVLLDKWSLIISYDERRGEPRGKKKQVASSQLPVASEERQSASMALPVLNRTAETGLAPSSSAGNSQLATNNSSGDCVACDLCVSVCPTGIDIRNGLQVECIGCAQCIDACDTVMDKVQRPRGLIRYSSQSVMSGEPKKIVRPRVIIYSLILLTLISLLATLIATRSGTDIAVLRNIGRPFVVSNEGVVENTMRVILTNRLDREQRYRIELTDPAVATLATTHSSIVVPAGQAFTEPVRIDAPAKRFVAEMGNIDVIVRVIADDGSKFERKARLLGPLSWSSSPLPDGAPK